MFINIADYFKRENILNKPYVGEVVSNEDPKKLGRVKVRIEGLLEGSVENLPWITQKTNSLLGGGNNTGSFFVPLVGSKLEITFPFGDIYAGFYSSFYQSVATHNEEFDGSYGDEYGFTDNGFVIKYNTEEKELTVMHPEGASFTISSSGAINFNTPDNFEITSEGEVSIVSEGSLNIKSDAPIEVESGGPTTIKATKVFLVNGALGAAQMGSQSIGTGNKGSPVVSNIIEASTDVLI